MRRHLLFLILPCLLGVGLLVLNAQVYSWRPIPLSPNQFASLPANEARHAWYFFNGTTAIETVRDSDRRGQPTQTGRIWNLKAQTYRTGPNLLARPESSARPMDLSSSGRWLAVAMEDCFDENACKSSLELHDLRTGRRRMVSTQSSLARSALETDEKPNFRLRFSPDEKKLYVAQVSGWDEFEVATGKRLFANPLPQTSPSKSIRKAGIIAATITADAQFLIQTDGVMVTIRELQQRKEVRRFKIPVFVPRPADRISFTSDGQRLLIKDASSPDGSQTSGWWYCYDSFTGSMLWNAAGENISGLSPDESEMYLYRQTFFEVRDARRGTILRTLPAVPELLVWWLSMDGETLFSERLGSQGRGQYFKQRVR